MDLANYHNQELDLHMILERKRAISSTSDPTLCRKCRRTQLDEIGHAIESGLVTVCASCFCPKLRQSDDNFSIPTDEDLRSCNCCCTCPETPNFESPPNLLPFAPNNRSATPKPWLQEWLGTHGFRSTNRQANIMLQQLNSNQNLPTRSSIIDGSYQIATSELAALPLMDFEAARTQDFPNGLARDATTDTGLPKQLEAIIRHLDGDAFGHITRQWLFNLSLKEKSILTAGFSSCWGIVVDLRVMTLVINSTHGSSKTKTNLRMRMDRVCAQQTTWKLIDANTRSACRVTTSATIRYDMPIANSIELPHVGDTSRLML